MFNKTLTLAAGAVGYVLGARAGRERFDQIKDQADRLRNNPTVQKATSNAHDFAAEEAPVVKDKVADMVNSSGDSGSTGADLPGTVSNPASSGSVAARSSISNPPQGTT